MVNAVGYKTQLRSKVLEKIYTKDLIKVLTALNVAAMLRWGACGGCTRLSRAKNTEVAVQCRD